MQAAMSKRKLEENNAVRVIQQFLQNRSQLILAYSYALGIPADREMYNEYFEPLKWHFNTFNGRVIALFEAKLLIEGIGKKPIANKILINKIRTLLDEIGTPYPDFELIVYQYKKKK